MGQYRQAADGITTLFRGGERISIQERCQCGRPDADRRSTEEMPPGQRQAIILESDPCIQSLVIVSSRFNSVLADRGISRQLDTVEGGVRRGFADS